MKMTEIIFQKGNYMVILLVQYVRIFSLSDINMYVSLPNNIQNNFDAFRSCTILGTAFWDRLRFCSQGAYVVAGCALLTFRQLICSQIQERKRRIHRLLVSCMRLIEPANPGGYSICRTATRIWILSQFHGWPCLLPNLYLENKMATLKRMLMGNNCIDLVQFLGHTWNSINRISTFLPPPFFLDFTPICFSAVYSRYNLSANTNAMQFFLLIFANRWFKSQRLMSRPKGINSSISIILNVKIGIIIANIYIHVLCAKHCSKHRPDVHTLNSHSSPMQ